jgi:hypothetical protein
MEIAGFYESPIKDKRLKGLLKFQSPFDADPESSDA